MIKIRGKILILLILLCASLAIMVNSFEQVDGIVELKDDEYNNAVNTF